MNSVLYEGIPLDIKEKIACCFGNHYIFDAHVLCCGGNTCGNCLDELKKEKIFLKCSTCDMYHGKDSDIARPITHVKQLIESYMGDLKKNLMKEYIGTKETFESIDEIIYDKIDHRFENIEYELDLRIESIIAGLHEYREEFMKEMNDAKDKLKRNAKTEELDKHRVKLENMSLKELPTSDYENFMKLCNELNESKAVLNQYLDKLNSIKFYSDTKVVYKELVGEFSVPIGKYVCCQENVMFSDDETEIKRISIRSDNKFLIINKNEYLVLHNFNRENDEEKIHLKKCSYPSALCIGRDDAVFVVDDYGEEIFMFDKNFKFKKRFETSECIDRISFDLHNKRNLIYATHNYHNEISVVNTDSGMNEGIISIPSPRLIKFHREYIYVVSCPLKLSDENEKIIDMDTNCIYILSKSSHEIVDKIKFNDWYQLFGLEFDEYGNLMTIAYELDKNRVVSNERYLFVINENKEILQKMVLNIKTEINDIIYANNKLYLLHDGFILIKEIRNY